MPSSRFSSSLSSPDLRVYIDMGNPFLNRTVDGFLKIGTVAAARVAAEETYHCVSKGGTGGIAVIAEVQPYGNVVLCYVSHRTPDPIFPPRFEKVEGSPSFPLLDYGIRHLDHAVGNVSDLAKAVAYVKEFTGFHKFAEFTTEDLGTGESGLNSVFLAYNDEMVLLPVNEPVFGTKRKSQIRTYLEHTVAVVLYQSGFDLWKKS